MTTSVTLIGNEFVCTTRYGEHLAVKAAGFRWNPQTKTWRTTDAEVAAKLRSACDEIAKRAIDRAIESAKKSVEASHATDAAADLVEPAGLSYLPYQRAGIAFALERPAVLIADEMGLGKTIQAIGIANSLKLTGESVLLVVCPASLRLNWVREIRKWDVHHLQTTLVDNPLTYPQRGWNVVSYEMATKAAKRWADVRFTLLVVDEAHYLKNPKAQRTTAILGAGKKAPATIKAARSVFLTGTPILNRPIELWPLVSALDPNGLGASWFKFASRYCSAYRTRYGWDVSGASNLEELQVNLRKSIMVRRLKSEVLTDLPPKTRQIINLSADGMEGALVNERAVWERHQDNLDALRVRAELAKAESDEAYAAAVQALRTAAGVAFDEISKARHDLAIAKLPQVIEHLESSVEQNKVVLFCHHKDVAKAIHSAIPGSVMATGDMDMEARQASVDRFQNDPDVKLFVGTIGAAGTGLTLTASSHVVFAELDWTPGRLSQAEDRCHRIGQKGNVLVQHLVVDGSLDANIAQAVVQKQAVIDAALDRDAQYVDPEEASLPVTPTAAAAATTSSSKKAIETMAAKLTTDQIAAIHGGLKILSAYDPDRASGLNNVGFNKMDTDIGNSLAQRQSLTPKQAALGYRIVLKYHRQLGVDLINRIKA